MIWCAVIAAIVVPVVAASTSPLLAWRDPIYILAGFAGIVAMCLMLLQPLLIAGYLPGTPKVIGQRVHRMVGAALVIAIIIHVAGLWITSPPDVMDALLFVSPTAFSVWGVIAMWAVFAAALLATFRKRLRLGFRTWRRAHLVFAVITVAGTVTHALLIEGTMETITKILLCALVVLATAKIILDLWVSAARRRRGT
nr:ferric reductase-like transmembrane domain-containing protein [Pseudaestuariivita rosea]